MMAAIDSDSHTVHTEPAGIAVTNVERWFAENVPNALAPFRYTLLAGGHSNLTYRVTDADGQHFVLRRPPLSSVLATAHDMGREWRVIHALQGSSVPVPPTHAFCSDPAVIGAPFYVMGLVDGYVQHTIDDTLANSNPAQRTLAGNSLFDVLADLHAIDIDAVGLGDHGHARATSNGRSGAGTSSSPRRRPPRCRTSRRAMRAYSSICRPTAR